MNNVYVRVITYVLSSLIGMIPPFAVGWFAFDYVDGWIRIAVSVEGAVLAGFTAATLAGGVFWRYGTK